MKEFTFYSAGSFSKINNPRQHEIHINKFRIEKTLCNMTNYDVIKLKFYSKQFLVSTQTNGE